MNIKKKTVGFRMTEKNQQRLKFLKSYYKTLNGDISNVTNSDVVNYAIEHLTTAVNEATDPTKVQARKRATINVDDYKRMSN